MSDERFKVGDRVTVKPEHRKRYYADSPAARGDVLTITGRNGNGWAIGPKPMDVAYDWELDPA